MSEACKNHCNKQDRRPPLVKCLVVSSAILHKYQRWDAGFYSGDDFSQDIALAQKGLEDAQKLLAKRLQQQRESEERTQRMVAEREIRPL